MKLYALTGLALIAGLAISCNRGTDTFLKAKAPANEASVADMKDLAC